MVDDEVFGLADTEGEGEPEVGEDLEGEGEPEEGNLAEEGEVGEEQ